jgi:stage II sporulation protein E
MLEQMKTEANKIRVDFLSRGEIALRRPLIIKSFECFVRFVLGFILSGARIFGVFAPFGVAITAASGSGSAGFSGLLGVMLGYLILGQLEQTIKYIIISALLFCISSAFRGTKILAFDWVMPLCAAFVSACIGMVYAAREGWTLLVTAMYVIETILIFGGSYFFKIALSPWGGYKKLAEKSEFCHSVSVLLLISCCLITVQRLQIGGLISIGRIVAVFIVLVASYRGGMAVGAATGISLGLAMDIGIGGVPFFSTAYAFAGLISGVFHKQGKLLFVLGYTAANAIAVLWAWEYKANLGALYESFISTVIFMLVPSNILASWGLVFTTGDSIDSSGGARAYAAARLNKASLAYRELYESLKTGFDKNKNDENIGTVFDNAAERVCRKCKQSNKCWNKDYMTTATAMNDAARKMMERRKLLKEDFPSYFLGNCLRPDQFTLAANEELKTLLYRRQYRERLRENQSVLFNQYDEMASVLGSVATELGSEISGSPAVERKLQKYLKGLDIEALTSVFRDRRGRLHVEVKGNRLSPIINDKDSLDKLSLVMGTRLCEDVGAKSVNGKVVLMEAEPLAASVGISSARKKGEQVNGDNGTYFKTEEGVLCVILSDGCGTGRMAAKESVNALQILERFLCSGIDAELSLRTLNSVMLLKNSDGTQFTTIDLLCIDLFSGEAKIIKYGAAPSYIKRANEVTRIECETLAAGLYLEGIKNPESTRLLLKEGDFVIVASDGVATALDDEWLKKIAADYSGGSARELSLKLLEEAVKKYGQEDDMTVLTILLQKRV